MSSVCQSFRQELDLAFGGDYSERLAEHLASCADCARFERGLQAMRGMVRVSAPAELDDLVAESLSQEGQLRRALASLGRLERADAPATLDGRVVAATQAGFRQDRAIEHVEAIPAVPAPRALDELVVGNDQKTPRELDERVSGELARPELYVGPRLARDLAPLDAPPELEARLSRQLAPRRRLLQLAYGSGMAAAAALLFWVGFGGSQLGVAPQSAPTVDLDDLSFDVRNVESAAELSPFARSLADGLSGGALLPEVLEEF